MDSLAIPKARRISSNANVSALFPCCNSSQSWPAGLKMRALANRPPQAGYFYVRILRRLAARFLGCPPRRTSRYTGIAALRKPPPHGSWRSRTVRKLHPTGHLFATNPSESSAEFDSLCSTIFQFVLLSDDLYELGTSARTSLASSKLRKRAFKWNSIDPGDLGILLLDDQLCTGSSGEQLSVFLFEEMLLCCSQNLNEQEGPQVGLVVLDSYPIADWEIGPALKSNTLLNIIHAIPTEHISALRCFEHDSFELDWRDGQDGSTKGLIFCRLSQEQCDQWCETLRPFTTQYYRSADLDSGRGHCISLSSPLPVHHQNQSALYLFRVFIGCPIANPKLIYNNVVVVGRSARPRSWSVIGRKGPRSDTSSFQQEKTEYLLSPNLLPRLFSTSSDGLLSTRSNKSSSKSDRYVHRALVQDIRVMPTEGTTSPAEAVLYGDAKRHLKPLDKRESAGSKPPPDLTGQIEKEAAYPSAGGGFADVWKGTWNVGNGSQDKVKASLSGLSMSLPN
ncbi:Serine/threonine-protein kinase [Salix suchowensis]|nr:Serine/threonine-protein kinase [Salix suchowensis]